MEQQNEFMGIPHSAWGKIGLGTVAVIALAICALIALMFGTDAGISFN